MRIVTELDARSLLRERIREGEIFFKRLLHAKDLSHRQVCGALVAIYGPGIFADADVRDRVLKGVSPGQLRALFEFCHGRGGFLKDVNDYTDREMRKACAGRKWVKGHSWARHWCEVLNLPPICAGTTAEGKTLQTEIVAPLIPLNPLHPFQEEIADQIRAILVSPNGRRALVTLPTGAGKTRVAVETVLDWDPIATATRMALWVAQHEELCEQAVQCFREVWSSKRRPQNRVLKIQRAWGSKSEDLDWNADVIVSTPWTLQPRLEKDRAALQSRLGIVIIDEAHGATAPSYTCIFEECGSTAAIIGLTATPAGSNDDTTRRLRNRFKSLLIYARSLGAAPLEALQSQRFLSTIKEETLPSGETLELDQEELDALKMFQTIPNKALARIGRSTRRNTAIVTRLLGIAPDDGSVLCFASSVESARALAAGMALGGRSAAVVDAETDESARAQIISGFRTGDIQFLFNYQVLAMGFDAPKIQWLVMARPTVSQVLLEQMLGRGLRGPRNFGTATCNIITIEDTYRNFGTLRPLGYGRFMESWIDAKR